MVRTNVYTLLIVFVRLVALVFVLRALLQGVTMIVLAFAQSGTHDMMGFQIAGILISIVLFGLVWLFADVLVKLALGRPQGATFESDLGADAWRAIGFGVIGMWFAANGVLDLIYAGLRWFYTRRMSGEYPDVGWGETLFADVWGSVAQIAIGVALLLGARGLVGMVRRMRGHDATPEPSEPS